MVPCGAVAGHALRRRGLPPRDRENDLPPVRGTRVLIVTHRASLGRGSRSASSRSISCCTWTRRTGAHRAQEHRLHRPLWRVPREVAFDMIHRRGPGGAPPGCGISGKPEGGPGGTKRLVGLLTARRAPCSRRRTRTSRRSGCSSQEDRRVAAERRIPRRPSRVRVLHARARRHDRRAHHRPGRGRASSCRAPRSTPPRRCTARSSPSTRRKRSCSSTATCTSARSARVSRS